MPCIDGLPAKLHSYEVDVKRRTVEYHQRGEEEEILCLPIETGCVATV